MKVVSKLSSNVLFTNALRTSVNKSNEPNAHQMCVMCTNYCLTFGIGNLYLSKEIEKLENAKTFTK